MTDDDNGSHRSKTLARRRRTSPGATDWRSACSRRPSVILLLVLGYPIVRMVILSLQEAKLRNIAQGTESWNNFANYIEILSDRYFWHRGRPDAGVHLGVRRCHHGARHPGRAAAQQVGQQDATVRAHRTAAGVGDAGGDRDADLAVAVRHPIRDRELGAGEPRVRAIRRVLLVGRAAVAADAGRHHRRLGSYSVRRADAVRRAQPDPERDVRGGRTGRCARRGPSSVASPPTAGTDLPDPDGPVDDLGLPRVHPGVHPAEGRRHRQGHRSPGTVRLSGVVLGE